MSINRKLMSRTPAAGGVSGPYLFVGVRVGDGISVIDVNDPVSSFSIETTLFDSTNLNATDYVAANSTDKILYAKGSASMSTIDISDPTSISRLSTHSSGARSDPNRVLLYDATNEVTLTFGGTKATNINLDIIDVSNPNDIVAGSVSTYQTSVIGGANEGKALSFRNSNEVLFGETSLYGLDYSNYTSSSYSFFTALSTNIGAIGTYTSGAWDGSTYYYYSSGTSVTQIDYSNTSSPSSNGSYVPVSSANLDDIVLDATNDVIYTYDRNGHTLYSIDTTAAWSNSAGTNNLDSLSTTFTNEGVCMLTLSDDLNTLYMTCDTDDRVTAFDVSDPSNMSQIATLKDTTNLNGARTCVEVTY